MNRHNSFLYLFLATALSLVSCSGVPHTVCTSNCTSGTGTLDVTFRSEAPLVNPSIISFQVTITGIQLNPSTGAAFNLTLNPAPTLELTRLQSDSAFLGTFATVPAANYTSATVTLSSPVITFFNNTNAVVSGCAVNQICAISPAASGAASVTTSVFPLTLLANTQQGLSLDFNLNNSVSISSGALTVNFQPASPALPVLKIIPLPTPNSTLAANQLDLVEDFTGVVSNISGQTITVQSATRGALTATATSKTNFDPGPNTVNPICATLNFSCVQLNQVASIDAVLNTDGTLSLQEFEPLTRLPQDLVEGTVVSINPNNLSQFTIVVTDKVLATPSSLVSGLKVGDALLVSIPSPNPFFVDTKGLNVPAVNLFAGQTTTAPLRLGQTLSVHVTAFNAAAPPTIASATADTVTLRWSRFTATAKAPFQPSLLNITNLPAYFQASTPQGLAVQTFSGTPGADGVTNYDGIFDPTGLTDGAPVALRTLFIENATNSSTIPFFAAKVRKP